MNEIIDLPREKGGEKDRKFVEALARGLDLLRAFNQQGGVLGNQDLARITGLPKPTISRLTYTLTQLGYLTYSKHLEKYQLDVGVLALGYAYTSNLNVRKIAKPYMEKMATQANISVGLTVRERLSMIYVENCRNEKTQALRMDVGSRLPLATSSSGRAFLAGLSDGERHQILSLMEQHSGDHWPAWQESISKAIDEYQEKGFCTSLGDWSKDVNAVAVPLKLLDGRVMAINCGGPKYLISDEMIMQSLGPQLVHVVRDIEATGV
ncbi:MULTISPECIES: IclR family transcriptional regulator [unclassified Endozoicomonas]|uniref:IclR family transcriptional regulator n=1 Tax=unclassified Endozoicomonas TaxID=2644528 RepID=UPI003BB79833